MRFSTKRVRTLLLFILLSIHFVGRTQNLSNAGKEFWVAWGHNVVTAGFVLYITSENFANINITVPGTSFTPITDIISPGQVKTYTIPYALGIMLTTEGINNNKAVHITSDVDIVAYAHQYAGASSGATMLMPVESYGRSYYSLNPEQITNQATSYSYFFIIASEDNTTVEVTPSVLTNGGSAANVTFTVNLMKGQIYNVFGRSVNNSLVGNDVSGSKIKSIAGADGICHPIAVFSGASRVTIIGSSGGDVVEQQIFPSQAWGRKYLTSPTVSTNSTFTNNPNLYRIAVRDPSTVVKRNGIIIPNTQLQRNFYYQFQSSVAEYIEANKPILVAQFIPSENTAGYDGNGDPEMFYLSPVEQGIRSAKFNATKNQSIAANFVNVVVPTVSAASLRIDGSVFWDNVYAHPNLPGYTVKVKRFAAIPNGVTNVQHSLTCDTTFTAITYGLGSVETYGYNAGTLINNLEVLSNIQNTEAVAAASTNVTCPNTPFNFKIRTIYQATKLDWLFSQVGNFSSPTNVIVNNPVPDGTTVVNGITYYTYSLPNSYQFAALGTYQVPVKIYNPAIDNCDSSTTAMVPVEVRPGPSSNFNFTGTSGTFSGCRLDTVVFRGAPNANNYNLVKYRWTFDDNTISQSLDTIKYIPTVGVHPVKFRVLADNGCSADTTINITVHPDPVTNFGTTPATACLANAISLTDTSSFTGSSGVTGWYWDFGNGQMLNATSGAPQSVSYTQPGIYTISHVAKASRCVSDTVRKVVRIWDKPQVNFTAGAGCLADSTTNFFNASSISDGQALTYSWRFGDANATPANPDTSSLLNPTHRYINYNVNQVRLVVKTVNGCTDSITKPYSVTGFAPPVNYSVLNEAKLCSNKQISLKSGLNIAQDSVYRIEIYWDTLAQPTTFEADVTPTQDELYNHVYASFTTPATKQVTVKWLVYSKGGCVGIRTKTITLQAMPVLSFNSLAGACINGGTVAAAQASITNSLAGTGYYYGTGVDSNGTFHPNIAGIGRDTIRYAFTTEGGCTDSVKAPISVFPKPIALFGASASVCLGDSIRITDTSSVATGTLAQWQWSFGDNTTANNNSGATFYHAYRASGSYTITLKVVSDSGCNSDTYQKSITTRPLPVVNFAIPPFICMPAGNATFTNQTTVSDGSALQYVWDFGDNSATSTVVSPSHTYATATNYNVKLTATSAYGCVKDTTKVLNTFYNQPTAAFGASNEFFCQGESITFRDSSTAPGSTITNWNWSFGDSTYSALRNPGKRYLRYGTYTVVLVTKNAQGCVSDTARKTIQVNLKPVISAGPSYTIAFGSQVMLMGLRNDSAVAIQWTPATSLSNDTILNPIARPATTTTYTMKGIGEGNCTATATTVVTVLKKIKIPNAFSPNNDGTNDRFEIPDLRDYFGSKVQIFDRYGARVFESIGYDKPWDGTVKGKPLPIGTYYYVIELNQLGYPPITGSVTILR